MKSLTNVKLYKDLSVHNLGERFVNQKKQVLVFFYKAIKLIIVYTEAQAAIKLDNKEDRKSEERAAKYNKALIKVF